MSANVNCKVWLTIKNKQTSKMCKYIFTTVESIFKFLNEENLKMKTI